MKKKNLEDFLILFSSCIERNGTPILYNPKRIQETANPVYNIDKYTYIYRAVPYVFSFLIDYATGLQWTM